MKIPEHRADETSSYQMEVGYTVLSREVGDTEITVRDPIVKQLHRKRLEGSPPNVDKGYSR